MTSIKAVYTAEQHSSKIFDVPVTSSSLVDSIQTIQNDINKFLTQIMEDEKKQGIKQPEIKEDDAQEEDEEIEVKEEEGEGEEEEEERKDEAQALKKQKLEA